MNPMPIGLGPTHAFIVWAVSKRHGLANNSVATQRNVLGLIAMFTFEVS